MIIVLLIILIIILPVELKIIPFIIILKQHYSNYISHNIPEHLINSPMYNSVADIIHKDDKDIHNIAKYRKSDNHAPDNHAPDNQSDTKKFDTSDIVADIFSENGNAVNPSDGDLQLAIRNKYTQQQSLQSKLHRTRMTSDNFRPYYQEELDEQEKRHWWEHDALDQEMVKDGVNWNML